MRQKKVKLGQSQTSRSGNAKQGLRILARIITRRLVKRKLDVEAPHPSGYGTPRIPGIVGEEINLDTGTQQPRLGKNIRQPIPPTVINNTWALPHMATADLDEWKERSYGYCKRFWSNGQSVKRSNTPREYAYIRYWGFKLIGEWKWKRLTSIRSRRL